MPKVNKTYNHYLILIKWFRTWYNKMSTLMRNNFGFGWDSIAKTFTGSNEVWKNDL